jgi:hypothetical protein
MKNPFISNEWYRENGYVNAGKENRELKIHQST